MFSSKFLCAVPILCTDKIAYIHVVSVYFVQLMAHAAALSSVTPLGFPPSVSVDMPLPKDST